MAKARIIQIDGGQAVLLPEGFQLQAEEVEIVRRGDELVLREKPVNLARAFEILANLPIDFLADGREDGPPQERPGL